MNYPTLEEIEQNVSQESLAISIAVKEMQKVIEASPLKDNLKVYAAIALAIHYGPLEYVGDVFSELCCTVGWVPETRVEH